MSKMQVLTQVLSICRWGALHHMSSSHHWKCWSAHFYGFIDVLHNYPSLIPPRDTICSRTIIIPCVYCNVCFIGLIWIDIDLWLNRCGCHCLWITLLTSLFMLTTRGMQNYTTLIIFTLTSYKDFGLYQL